MTMTDDHPNLETKDAPIADAATGNDNGLPAVVADTTWMLGLAEVRDAIQGTLVNHGVERQELDDGVGEVQVRALQMARAGKMPASLGEWKALVATIASNFAIDETEAQAVQEKYDVGLCEDPDERGPLQRASARDPVDTRTFLEILAALFRQGAMPEHGREILEAVAEGVEHKDIAAELGISASAVRNRLARMRKSFRKRVAMLGMATLMLLVWALFAVPFGAGVAANEPAGRPDEGQAVPVVSARVVNAGMRAARLRDAAMHDCAAQRWTACLHRLDEAQAVDPEGDDADDVQAARRRAYDGLEAEQHMFEAKPR